MDAIVVQNRNRAHAVQQLKKYLKIDDAHEADLYLNASFANALIYLGDSLASIAKSLNPEDVIKYGPVDIDNKEAGISEDD
jgi:hypothetical protein